MPIYEFMCHTCGLTFEEILSAKDETTPPCPKCQNSDQVRKCLTTCARPIPSTGSGGSCMPKSGFS